MAIKISLGFIVLIFMLKGISAAAIDTKMDTFFTAPKSLNIGQDNELQLLRFGCLDESTLKVRLYYTKSYGSDELLLQEQNFQIEKGKKDSLLQLNVKSVDDGDYIYSGRLQINGTMCGKPISGSDDVDFSNSKPNIYIIQTDKPMYKPGQEVKFRVLKMDKNLKPSNKANDTADVYVEDPQGNKLFQFKGVQLGKGIAEMKFPLADEPVHGTWRIFLSDKHDSPSTTFDVKEYKLPKFSVSIEFPSFVLKNANTIPVSVCAEYTYGEPVTGTLNLNTSLEIYSYQSSYSRTPILHNSVQINGCYNYTINVDSIDPDRRFNYKRIQVTANVTEKGTGIQKS